MSAWGDLAGLAFAVGEAFGVGGTAWRVTLPGPAPLAGLTEPPLATRTGTSTGYVTEAGAGAQSTTDPGTAAPRRRYEYVSRTADVVDAGGAVVGRLAPGVLIESVATGRRFALVAPLEAVGYVAYSAEER